MWFAESGVIAKGRDSVDMSTPSVEKRRPNILDIGSLAAQSFAIFIGLSILLGRVYLILYTKNLGIPVSSMNIGPIDNALFSPDIAIIGVAIGISIPLVLVTMASIASQPSPGSVLPSCNDIQPTTRRPLLFFVGVVIAMMLGFLITVLPGDFFVFQGPPVVIRGFLGALGVVIFAIGLSGFFVGVSTRVTPGGATVVRYIAYALGMGFLVVSLGTLTVDFANQDSFKDVTQSPKAILEVAAMESPMELRASFSSRADTLVPVNVVYINDNFTFIVDTSKARSLKAKSTQAGRRMKIDFPIYMIPNGSIRNIKYLNE